MGFEDIVDLWQCGVKSRKVSRVNLEEGAYLYKLVRSLSEPFIVEIGTKFGGTTKLLQEANPLGVVVSIDLDPSTIKTKLDGEKTYTVKANSAEVDTDLFLKELQEVDLLFIDGDHLLPGVKGDWDKWSPTVKKGGHIVFHDCYLEKEVKYKTVIDLIEDLKQRKVIDEEYEEVKAVASLCHLIKK